jgi:hypothetical protein
MLSNYRRFATQFRQLDFRREFYSDPARFRLIKEALPAIEYLGQADCLDLLAFLEALHDRFPNAMEDRQTKLLLSPTIFCSLGALVTPLVREENPEKFKLGNPRELLYVIAKTFLGGG